MYALIIILVIAVILLCSSLRVVRQANAYVIERLGTYTATWGVGLHLKMPIIDKVARRVSLKEQVADFPPQPVITKDNVTMRIDTVLFFQITDPKLYCYGVENPLAAIENLTATTLRNIIGDLELDQTLTSRETINSKMRATLDEATDPWGIKVNRVELKNIMPPAAIQESMEKQMKAERERREQIIRAEGEKQAAITVSEGEKEAKILRATADKEATILAAEAKKQAAILEAQAQREAAIQRAQGNAEAIRQVQQAEAEAVKMMNEASPSQATIAVRGLSTFERAANGPANKLIIPSELAGVTSLATAVTEAIKTGKEDSKELTKA
ncbi:MAG: paraslipin [Eubacterium sp.]|nr:paraslipin [Eubacterium sp.]